MHGFANRGGGVRKETGALSVFYRKAVEAAGNIEQVNTGFLKLLQAYTASSMVAPLSV